MVLTVVMVFNSALCDKRGEERSDGFVVQSCTRIFVKSSLWTLGEGEWGEHSFTKVLMRLCVHSCFPAYTGTVSEEYMIVVVFISPLELRLTEVPNEILCLQLFTAYHGIPACGVLPANQAAVLRHLGSCIILWLSLYIGEQVLQHRELTGFEGRRHFI